MSQLSDKYYRPQQLKEIAVQNEIPERYHEDFVRRFEAEVEVMTKEAELGETEIGDAGIDFAVKYFKNYDQQVRAGHGAKWSEFYAEARDEHPASFNYAFAELKKINQGLANSELKIYCRFAGKDALFEKHFILLMEHSEGLSESEKQSSIYTKTVMEQIASGKSEVFAHQYADYIAEGEYNEAFCFIYASKYEEAIRNGRSEMYALNLANKMADYYGDQYSSSKDIKYDDYDKMKEAEIIKSLNEVK
jgi:hypothetical protein